MSMSDITRIEESIAALHRVYYQHRAWEDIQQEAGVQIERASALTLKVVTAMHGTCRIQDIADRLSIEAPSVTRRIQQLESDGLVKRIPDAKDGRVVRVEATAAGKALLAKVHAVKQAHLRAVLSEWKHTDRRQFAHLLERFAADLADQSFTYK